MIICFDCDKKTKTLLDDILDGDDYSAYDEIIVSAVHNLYVLRNRMGDSGSVVLSEGNAGGSSQATSPESFGTEAKTRPWISGSNGKKERADVEGPRSVPTFFTMPELVTEDISLAPLVADQLPAGGSVPMREWLFGQYNKLLPAKASCRGLVSLLQDSPDGVELERARDRVSAEAARLCTYLAWLDERHGRGKGESLATAFPKEGNEKSIRRYADQFVGSVNKSGALSGILVGLKLADKVSEADGAYMLGLTRAGLAFARLANPLLDAAGREAPEGKFSDEEREFLVNHIRENVAVEYYAYKMVARGVLEDADAPESLKHWLAQSVPLGDGSPPSEAYLGSQKAGAVSRMIDLGLLVRSHEGPHVRYQVTDKGQELLAP
ncbi:hypothetical protein LCGC14_0124370 [marine sediment metagenome]|uniref:Uncharacterized protein n=1 Tax=marine sediment metagenome TaxID=412755 RepID=A0A0F9VL99_9ZZZZ|nr:hypothetical protein [Phycisphaerae bacterium]HDZ42337.1 hypothetical protein [Phycisphaerae bacterium]